MTKKELEKEVIELRKRVIKLESAEATRSELADIDRNIKECQKRLRNIDLGMYSKYAGYNRPLCYTPPGVFNSTQMYNW